MDRGFNEMVPKAKEEVRQDSIYDYDINFTLFGNRFSLSFRVDKTKRSK
tara:strand:+ start:391 stop:537 length:147 start_codon:yes stop_codon:yes gene_type:complete